MNEKTCPKCGQTYPLNPGHWHRNKNSKDRFAGWCKKCINSSNKTKDIPLLSKVEKELTYQGIPQVDMEQGHVYKFILPGHGNGKRDSKFQGKVIQVTDKHITLKHKLGYCETFLKWDLAQLRYVEVLK